MTIAIYAGTFDPLTLGHVSVVRRAARVFTHVRVLIAVNPQKVAIFSLDERVEMARELLGILPNVSVDATTGLVIDYARRIGASFLVRGLRGADDADSETMLAQLNRELAPEIFTVLLPADADLTQVSSSALKERLRRGEDVGDVCPPRIAEELRRRLGSEERAR